MERRPMSALNNKNNFSKTFYGQNPYSTTNQQYGGKSGFAINDRPQSSVFFGDKTKTSNFFQSTRVDSCSHIKEVKGRTFAVPFKVTNHKGRPLSAYKYNTYKKEQYKSVYQNDYSLKKNMHLGMSKKPLILYDPNSSRSRLPINDFYMAHKNQSKVDIGIKTDINRKQWLSTTRDSYQWPQPTPVTHSGILASTFRNSHKKLVSHH